MDLMTKVTKILALSFVLAVPTIGILACYIKWQDQERLKQVSLEIKTSGVHPLSVLKTIKGTEHFLIYSNYDMESLRKFERFFEGFYHYFQTEYFDPNFNKPLKIYLFKNNDTYGPYAKRRGVSYTPGFYSLTEEAVFVNAEDDGLSIAIHEVVHHFVQNNVVLPPSMWIREGIPMFFERFIAYFDEHDELVLTFGYFSSRRYPEIGDIIRKYTIDDILIAAGQYSHSSCSLMFLLYQKGFLKPFIQQVPSLPFSDYHGFAALENVYGKPIRDIEKDWKSFVESHLSDEEACVTTESLLMTHEEYQQWWQDNQDRLIWNESEQKFQLRRQPSNGIMAEFNIEK